MRQDAFASCHPAVCFTFFIGALAFGMVFIHPAYTGCALVCASAYYLTVRRSEGIRAVAGMLPLFALLSAVNPLFNTLGQTVLFTVFGRPYTWEALCYGMALAGMFVAVMLWFMSYSAVMSSDKFMSLFGRLAPALSLLLTLILRLVPDYTRRAKQIAGARRCIGKGMDGGGTYRARAQDGAAILSALASWALESSIVTGDSMRARGYGMGRRSTFTQVRFTRRDRLLLAALTVLGGAAALIGCMGGARAAFVPALELADGVLCLAGLVCYALYLLIPTILNLWEEAVWHSLRSKI